MSLENYFGMQLKQTQPQILDHTEVVTSQSKSSNNLDSSLIVHFNPNIEAFINRIESQAPKEVLGI